MTYYSTPQATQTPANSQSQILQNFSQISNSYGTDHVPFTGSTQGYHKQITFNAPLTPSAPAGNVALLYTQLVNSVPQLFFQNSSSTEQITGSSSLLASGYIVIGGLYIQWGGGSMAADGSSFTFPTPFPHNCFAVVMSCVSKGNDPSYFTANSITASGVGQVWHKGGGLPTNFNFIAIGN